MSVTVNVIFTYRGKWSEWIPGVATHKGVTCTVEHDHGLNVKFEDMDRQKLEELYRKVLLDIVAFEAGKEDVCRQCRLREFPESDRDKMVTDINKEMNSDKVLRRLLEIKLGLPLTNDPS